MPANSWQNLTEKLESIDLQFSFALPNIAKTGIEDSNKKKKKRTKFDVIIAAMRTTEAVDVKFIQAFNCQLLE